MHPLPAATGPWDPGFQNGVALSGLMAHVFETTPCADGMDVARFHIDILKPTPMRPFRITVTPVRDGRRLQVLDAELRVDGELTARASAVRLRRAETPVAAVGPAPAPPEAWPSRPLSPRRPIHGMVESRKRDGSEGAIGPGAAWFRLTGDIVEGSPITPFVQMALVSDMGSGQARVVDYRTHTFANIDISVNLARAPRGDWVLIESEAVSHGEGRALVNTLLSDREGLFARAHQTLFIDPRG